MWRRTWSELDGTELHVEGGLDSKESACNAGDPGLIPGSGRSPRERNGNPLQFSCLENSMDGGAWRATVQGIAESDTTERLIETHTHLPHSLLHFVSVFPCV